MAEFKGHFDVSVRRSAQRAFITMDLNSDGGLDTDEFGHAAGRLRRPLSAEEATGVFSQMDSDGDGRLALSEFSAAFGSEASTDEEASREAMDAQEDELGVARTASRVAVQMDVPFLRMRSLTSEAVVELKTSLVESFAFVTGADPSSITDVDRRPARVSLWEPLAYPAAFDCTTGRPNKWALQQIAHCCKSHNIACNHIRGIGVGGGESRQGLTVEALIRVPPQEAPEDIVAVLASDPTRRYVRSSLDKMAQVKNALLGSALPGDISIVAQVQPPEAPSAAEVAATAAPPITMDQFRKRLAEASKEGTRTPVAGTAPLTVRQFRKRLARAAVKQQRQYNK